MKPNVFLLAVIVSLAGTVSAQAQPSGRTQELGRIASQFPRIVDQYAQKGLLIEACKVHGKVQQVLAILQSNTQIGRSVEQEYPWAARNILSAASAIEEMSQYCAGVIPLDHAKRIQNLAHQIAATSLNE